MVFRVLVAALTISLIACSIHRTPGMFRTATKPRVDVGPAFFEHAPQHEAIVARHSAAETQAVVEGVLKARRYRTLAMDDGVVHLYADRYRWLSFSGLIAHLSIVVILAGAIIGGDVRLPRLELHDRRGRHPRRSAPRPGCRSSWSTSPTPTTRRPAPPSTT